MIHHDFRHWPLVIHVSAGLQTLDDLQRLSDDWSHWLQRNQPFAVLRLFVDADALVHPEGSAQQAKQWLQRSGDDIRRLVMGMAHTVPASHYDKMRKMNVEKLFGVPGAIFADTDIDAAIAWTDERMQAAGSRSLPCTAVRRAVDEAVAFAIARAHAAA